MQHQHWIKRTLVSAAVAASFGLTACGGGSTSDGTVDTTTTLSGVVADGYLVNATVCLDLNLSYTCDLDEPSATSTGGGQYSLDATQAQIDAFPVVAVIIAGTTVDEDNPAAPVAKAYTLSAPAGKGAFVSPLTTMVQTQIKISGKTIAQIEAEILASMGQDPIVVSLFDDYVAQTTDPANSTAVQDSYLQMHQVAQVTAATIANNTEAIEAAISSGTVNMDLSTTLDSLITIIVQNVINELAAISTAVETSTTFDAGTIATTVVAPIDTATIEDQVAVTEATLDAVIATNVEAVFANGLSWLWAEFQDWGSEMERSTITYDAVTGKLSEPMETYSMGTSTPSWSPLVSGSDSLVLQANGTWLAVVDSWDGVSVTFDNTAGTATVDSNRGMEALSNIKNNDLTGLSVKAFVANKLPGLAAFIDPASVFTAGSSAYSLNFTTLEDSYNIWTWEGCAVVSTQLVNINCNTVIDPDTGVAFTSLTGMPSPAVAWIEPAGLGDLPKTYAVSIYANLYFELVQGDTNTSGPVNYYHNPTGTLEVTKVGTGTWAMTTVNGVEMLMVDHPNALMSQFSALATDMDSPEENHFFVIQEAVVRLGRYAPAGVVETTAESLLTNQQAQDEIIGAFITATIVNTIPSVELTCDTDSEWNPLIDKPLVSYSFADYEAVVTACGGAQTVDANALALSADGFARNHRLSDGAYIQFQLDNTGTYQKDSVNINFNWTIDLVTNYITIENSPTSFRDILAVVSVDSTVIPAVFTFKGYIEQIGRSDMVTNQGSDGEI